MCNQKGKVASSILIATSNCDELNQISNSVLLHISKWFQVNQFVLNADKTNYRLHKLKSPTIH